MVNNTQKGKYGEKLAENYLLKKGYEILERNYRFRRSEIDLIALQDNLLVFIEVKSLKKLQHGFPEERVNGKKIKMIKDAAEDYIFAIQWEKDIRFDIISIHLNSDEIFHIEDAFF